MTPRTFAILMLVWFCTLLALVPGCSTNIASGTETGNPDIRACANEMAAEALAALETGNGWQPSTYLDSSQAADTATNAPLLSAASSGLAKQARAASDTMSLSDSLFVVYDTVYLYDTTIRKDTNYVYDTLPIADTLAKTLPLSGDTLTTERTCKKGFIVICDTAVITDTLLQSRASVVVKILKYPDGKQVLYAVADTLWITGDTTRAATNGMVASPPLWELSDIVYQKSGNQVPVYLFVSTPLMDTVSVPAHAGNWLVNARQVFVSSQKTVGTSVVEWVSFTMNDSTLRLGRYYPFAADTVESLTTAYKVDIGQNISSAADDRLLWIARGVSYRPLSGIKHIALRITPDAGAMTGGEPSSGSVSLSLTKSNGGGGTFYGAVSRAAGLVGTYTQGGVDYQIAVPGNGAVLVTKVIK
jgi:hypothetical protein